MVLPLIIGIALIGILFTFRNEIKAFAQDFRQEKTADELLEQQTIDERGALANTTAFFLGEQGLLDLQKAEADRIATNQSIVTALTETIPANVDQFIKDAQLNIDNSIAGVNATLAEAQKNLEQFAQEAQTNIVESSNSLFEDITNFFGSFGGQQDVKPIATNVVDDPKIMTQDGKTFDLSFLTSAEDLEANKLTSFTGNQLVTTNDPIVDSTSSAGDRFSGTGSLR